MNEIVQNSKNPVQASHKQRLKSFLTKNRYLDCLPPSKGPCLSLEFPSINRICAKGHVPDINQKNPVHQSPAHKIEQEWI